MSDDNGGMGELAEETVGETNAELADEEAKLLLNTTVNLEDLRPNVTDQETYDKLIAAVKEATQQNNNIALLQNKLKTLGQAGMKVFNSIKGLL